MLPKGNVEINWGSVVYCMIVVHPVVRIRDSRNYMYLFTAIKALYRVCPAFCHRVINSLSLAMLHLLEANNTVLGFSSSSVDCLRFTSYRFLLGVESSLLCYLIYCSLIKKDMYCG